MKLDPAAILEELKNFSTGEIGVTRLPFTPAHKDALRYLENLMQAARLTTRLDAAGTFIGRREGHSPRTLLLGSHQDSVPKGGAFDGIMGIVLPICALASIEEVLPFSVEVLAFADEEGVRFPTALMGPRALAGSFDMADLEGADQNGTRLDQAMTAFGLDPEAIPQLRRNPADVITYIETHIEQGPVLEKAGQALGVVSAICGIERHHIGVTGASGHAGTLPMDMRRDALVAAAEIITKVDEIARESDGLIATIGEIHNAPNAVNAVSGHVKISLEIRAAEDATRQAGRERIMRAIGEIADRRGVTLFTRLDYEQKASPCDVALQDLQRDVLDAPLALASGATHDASAMADLCPIAMFFVRCKGGISHTPDEWVDAEDLQAASRALRALILKVSESEFAPSKREPL